uniref:Uncharacterized protein n=1 Tax=Photinus pyralis TaxID=7054 RepID=A0A1Y1JUB5_PHOPY
MRNHNYLTTFLNHFRGVLKIYTFIDKTRSPTLRATLVNKTYSLNLISNMIATLLFILKALLAMTKALYRYIIPKSKKSVNGETVLVTGAGDGIGKEVALIYASAGATVVCIDINAEANEETIRTIANLGYAKAYAYTCDVSDYQQVVFIINKIEQEVGNVTILVNNAGILFGNPFCELSATEIEKMIQVNLMSHFWVCISIRIKCINCSYSSDRKGNITVDVEKQLRPHSFRGIHFYYHINALFCSVFGVKICSSRIYRRTTKRTGIK